MRSTREETARTRARIVEAASRAFRRGGIVATGLGDLMKDAGLTHGGFYKHFASKDELVAEACGEAVEEIMTRLEEAPARAVAVYLSPQHCEHPDRGCPFAAIGAELARADDATRDVATRGFERFVALLGGEERTKAARRAALVKAATMIGALTMARVVTDPALAAELLDAAAKSVTRG